MAKHITTVAAFKAAFFDALDIGFIKPADNKSDFDRSITDYATYCRDCECLRPGAVPAGRTVSGWFAEYTATRD